MTHARHAADAEDTKWGVVRMCLGMLQMAGATVAVVLLVETGVSTSSLLATVVACALTTVSVLLFGSKHPRLPGRRPRDRER